MSQTSGRHVPSFNRRAFLSGAALTAPLLLPRAASASLVLAMELPELTAQSERIVVGDVTDVTSAWETGRRRIYSRVQVQVGESWKGDVGPGGAVTIVQPGGVVGDIEMRVHGLPSFAQGERAVLFLRGRARSSLVGLGQGKRPIILDPQTRRWMVERPDRSAAVLRDRDGRLHRAPDDERVPLDDLRSRVRALLTR